MGHHRKAISQVYGWMADELSREIFEKIVRFRMLDDSIDVPTNPQERQYFEESLYEKKNDEIFVDCGAFNGISLKAFLHECGDQTQALTLVSTITLHTELCPQCWAPFSSVGTQ